MNITASLDNVSIVLVNTKTPANIGAVARCMMNMGLSRLTLVNPPDDPLGQAVKLAAGAGQVLDTAATHSTLADAVAEYGLVIGTSRHSGRRRQYLRTPREAAALAMPLLTRNRVALVFGNEVNGLENQDLALCQELISIPSSEAFPSLNLSHAVLVVAYELFMAAGERLTASAVELASSDEREGFFHHLREILLKIDFLDHDHPERMMSLLRRLFGKARMDSREISILRGILSNMERCIRSTGRTR